MKNICDDGILHVIRCIFDRCPLDQVCILITKDTLRYIFLASIIMHSYLEVLLQSRFCRHDRQFNNETGYLQLQHFGHWLVDLHID